nr:TetR/AcrR family transcriptional regulator [Mycobacterium parascrofulaceum]
MLAALEDSIADTGYAETTVADVVRRARTSRRTFYQHFDSKQDCYIALLTDSNATMIKQITAAVEANSPWPHQARQAIEAWAGAAESRPALMLSWIRDVPALGAAARRLQLEFMESFIVLVQALCNTDALQEVGVGPVSRQRAIMLLGGLRELTATTLESGGRISDITEEAVEATLALLGPRAATAHPSPPRAQS